MCILNAWLLSCAWPTFPKLNVFLIQSDLAVGNISDLRKAAPTVIHCLLLSQPCAQSIAKATSLNLKEMEPPCTVPQGTWRPSMTL